MALSADAAALVGELGKLRDSVERGTLSILGGGKTPVEIVARGTTLEPTVSEQLARFDAAMAEIWKALKVETSIPPVREQGKYSSVGGARSLKPVKKA